MCHYTKKKAHGKNLLRALYQEGITKNIIFLTKEMHSLTLLIPCSLIPSIEEIKDYITGQNSDGLGEGFEQQDIEIDGSVMNVHFWESGKDYRIYDEDEFEAEIRSDQGMGGLS